MFEAEQTRVEERIRKYCIDNRYPEPEFHWNWIPFSGQWGISLSFFQLASKSFAREKGNVAERSQKMAQELAESLQGYEGFSKIEAIHGYLNLYFSSQEYMQRVVDTVLEKGSDFGRGEDNNQQWMIEFSHPNTHKAFHVGHLRSAILGDVLARILDFAGYDVVRANYPGDMGLHVIKWLWNYNKYHKGEHPDKNVTKWMGALYTEAARRLEEDPELESEVREIYVRWDNRDPEIVKLWEETRDWSLKGFNQIYDLLGIRFDRYYFNSMFEELGKAMVEELIKTGIASDERSTGGAVVVKLDEKLGLKSEKYHVFVVLRSDNTALYATEDLALARQKFTDYPELKRSLYVVDVRQSLHFQQLFKTLELAGYPWAVNCQHLAYELVSLPGNVVMASRDGTVVLLEDLIEEATQRALEVVRVKNPDLSEDQKLKVAKAVGIGAIKYPMLSRESTKVVTFDWETAMDFNGQTAPYIQYAFVRANSILRKAGGTIPASVKPEYSLGEAEIALVDLISRIPTEVQKAARDLKPLVITTLSFELAQAFNDFYTQCPVLQAEEPVRTMRLRLVAAARQAIENSLALLGITAPQAM